MKKKQHSEEANFTIDGISSESLKTNKFSTPDGYFENLTPRIMSATRESAITAQKPAFNWWRVVIPSLGCAMALFTLWFFNINTESTQLDFNEVVASVSLEELDDYADFESEELLAYQLISEDDLDITNDIHEQDVIEYLLIEEDIQLEEIYSELDI